MDLLIVYVGVSLENLHILWITGHTGELRLIKVQIRLDDPGID